VPRDAKKSQFFKKDFIYLFARERERRPKGTKQGERQVEGEAGSPLSREPNAELDSGTLES